MLVKNISGVTQVFPTPYKNIEVLPNAILTLNYCPEGFKEVTAKEIEDEIKQKQNTITEEVQRPSNLTEAKGLMKAAGIFGPEDSNAVIGEGQTVAKARIRAPKVK